MAMTARTWMHDSGIHEILSVTDHVARYVDDFVWHQGMINSDLGQGMVNNDRLHEGTLMHPSDEETVATETNSVGLEELDEIQDRPRSIDEVTATDPDDFNDEHWGMMEFAGEHPFEDYEDWFHGDEESCDADTERDDLDFRQGD
jgi:hypothetical protein